jgi:hypothetical protein
MSAEAIPWPWSSWLRRRHLRTDEAVRLQRGVRHHLAIMQARLVEDTDEPLPSPSVNARAGALVDA